MITFRIFERMSSCLLHIKKERSITMTHGGIQCLSIRNRSPSLLLTTCWDHKIYVYGWRSLRDLAVLNFHSKSVQSLDVHEERNLIVSGSGDGTVAIWRIY